MRFILFMWILKMETTVTLAKHDMYKLRCALCARIRFKWRLWRMQVQYMRTLKRIKREGIRQINRQYQTYKHRDPGSLSGSRFCTENGDTQKGPEPYEL